MSAPSASSSSKRPAPSSSKKSAIPPPAPTTTSSSAATGAAVSRQPMAKRPKSDNTLIDLEERVKALQAENVELKLQLKVGKEPNVSKEEEEKQSLSRELEAAVKRKASDAELQSLLRTFIVRFADHTEDREKLVEKHLDQLEHMLTPSQITKMCLWTLQQDEFFEVASIAAPAVDEDPDSVFATMLKVISASPDQVDKFKQHRADARILTRGLRFMTRECADIRQRVAMKNKVPFARCFYFHVLFPCAFVL